MRPLLYSELIPWYRLLDPTEDHASEAKCYRETLEQASWSKPETLLELGAGAGNNAFHLKQRFRCTLTDISEPMLSLSRELNPECEHIAGDMRTLRLGRQFDVVLVHDAVMYMTTEADLLAAARTALEHTRPNGVTLFVPDCVKESFEEQTVLHEGEDGARSLRCLEWTWDPDPNDDTFTTEYTFLLRDGATMNAVHDRHVEGVFSRERWLRILREAGFDPETTLGDIGEGYMVDLFLAWRPP